MVQCDGPIYRDQYWCNAINIVSAEFGECKQFHTVPVSVWVGMNLLYEFNGLITLHGNENGTGTGTKWKLSTT